MNKGTLKNKIIFGLKALNVCTCIWSSFSDMISMIPKKIHDKYILAVDPIYHHEATNFETGVIKLLILGDQTIQMYGDFLGFFPKKKMVHEVWKLVSCRT